MQSSRLVSRSLVLLAATPLTASAHAQVTFSIDNGSDAISTPDAFSAVPITEGDILTPSTAGAPGPNPAALAAPTPPGTSYNAGFDLGLAAYGSCVGHATSTPCPVDVDALSYGRDLRVETTDVLAQTYWFSVDEVARGLPGTAPAPTVFTEGALIGTFEAAGDVFANLGGGAAPLAPYATPGGNMGMLDGNGIASTTGAVDPGFGLLEPGGLWPFLGDDVDAVDTDGLFIVYPVFYSLDSGYVDPVLGIPLQASAAAHGFVGGDVLVTLAASGPPVLYASAATLGLDFAGPDTDDLDALALWENGTAGFQPSIVAYDWNDTFPTDMLIFSVRRGSAVIGMPDSRYGIPIEEGDLLSTPLPASSGGVSPFPSIWIAAENLGLQTARNFLAGGNTGDDIDALDMREASFVDCNGNLVPDELDISTGTSTDVNTNGVPDECELISTVFCFCTPAAAPCGNDYPTGGCENSTGLGGLLSATGTGSVLNDDLFLEMSQLPPTEFGIVFMGPASIPAVPLADGIRCVGGNLFRFVPPFITTTTGTASVGPMVDLSLSIPGGEIFPGSTWNFQSWFRDPTGPCAAGSNTTNAMSIVFTP